MLAKYAAALAVLSLGGCAGLPDWTLFARTEKQASVTSSGEFDFAWRLSGEPAVAPLQVFDNGRQMWLQFAPEQPVPAVFAHTADGDRLLEYRREGPYVVLDRVWPHLILRGGLQSSRVDRFAQTSGTHLQPGVGIELEAPGAAVVLALPNLLASGAQVPKTEFANFGALKPEPALVHEVQASSTASPSVATLASLQNNLSSLADAGLSVAERVPDTSADMVEVTYDVSPQDQNMRLALMRWASLAGWTFGAEHWSVDADIPIAGSAQFQSGFKQAVQALMAATELADRPLQPCFYSNKVLRIIPYAQPCNRVASLSGNS